MFFYNPIAIVLAIITPIANCFAVVVWGSLAYLWYSCWRESIARNLQRNPDLHGVGLYVIGFAGSFLLIPRAVGGAGERVLELGAGEVIDKVLSAVARIMGINQVGPSHRPSLFLVRCSCRLVPLVLLFRARVAHFSRLLVFVR